MREGTDIPIRYMMPIFRIPVRLALFTAVVEMPHLLADGYYYFLVGTPPNDLIIKKIDTSTWEMVDSTIIDMETSTKSSDDMMLAYANGNLIASGLARRDRCGGRRSKESGSDGGNGHA